MATGIRDKVAILGMGCSKFGERWDASAENLMVEAYEEGRTIIGTTGTQHDTPDQRQAALERATLQLIRDS